MGRILWKEMSPEQRARELKERGLIDNIECARRVSEAVSDFERTSLKAPTSGKKPK